MWRWVRLIPLRQPTALTALRPFTQLTAASISKNTEHERQDITEIPKVYGPDQVTVQTLEEQLKIVEATASIRNNFGTWAMPALQEDLAKSFLPNETKKKLIQKFLAQKHLKNDVKLLEEIFRIAQENAVTLDVEYAVLAESYYDLGELKNAAAAAVIAFTSDSLGPFYERKLLKLLQQIKARDPSLNEYIISMTSNSPKFRLIKTALKFREKSDLIPKNETSDDLFFKKLMLLKADPEGALQLYQTRRALNSRISMKSMHFLLEILISSEKTRACCFVVADELPLFNLQVDIKMIYTLLSICEAQNDVNKAISIWNQYFSRRVDKRLTPTFELFFQIIRICTNIISKITSSSTDIIVSHMFVREILNYCDELCASPSIQLTDMKELYQSLFDFYKMSPAIPKLDPALKYPFEDPVPKIDRLAILLLRDNWIEFDRVFTYIFAIAVLTQKENLFALATKKTDDTLLSEGDCYCILCYRLIQGDLDAVVNVAEKIAVSFSMTIYVNSNFAKALKNACTLNGRHDLIERWVTATKSRQPLLVS